MNYTEALHYLFHQLPSFERQGASGYKPGLQTSMALDRLTGCPHRSYRCIHVAGTNGKGSTSHLIASTLQMQGYKVGLYTSPHIFDFRERIRVNGEKISEEEVVDFTQRCMEWDFDIQPTFFELTSAMALEHFRRKEVDFAVIEVGLGGRLDSTNIITPVLSVITNISPDHTQFLGNTPAEIAAEKAGIIKSGVPAVVGEAEGEVRRVFEQKALEMNAPITFAQDAPEVMEGMCEAGHCTIHTAHHGTLVNQLTGQYQIINSNTALSAIHALQNLGIEIGEEAIRQGFAQVVSNTGFIGRWQTMQEHPRVVCDGAHNVGAFTQIVRQLATEHYGALHMIIGFMADKDVDHILRLLPTQATYYFTQAATPRALPAEQLQAMAAHHALHGNCYPTATAARQAALAAAHPTDLILLTGSLHLLGEVRG
ncbi:MAG: bifunctional folylpolyglutamate synthase/dihydrofolate synthase [Sodaliphilus sp.]